MRKHNIFLNTPAIEWETAFPTGCAKMGSMLYGNPHTECWQLNEERIWAGVENTFVPENYKERFLHVRELLKQGKPVEADEWSKQNLMDVFTNVSSYETAGEVLVTLPDGEITQYKRNLCIEDGVATVKYRKAGRSIPALHHWGYFTHEAFCSYPDQVMVLRISCQAPVSYGIAYQRENLTSLTYAKDGIRAEGMTTTGEHPFTVAIRLQTDGQVAVQNGSLQVTEAKYITLITAIRTAGEPVFPENMDYETLKERHVADMNAIMGRSTVEFPLDPVLEGTPTDGRLARVRAGGDDPGLIETHYAFGKYLLISSSRGDSLPANLQGVWNERIFAEWESDYHLNINMQMNYWHAETAGLAECVEPLFNYMNNNLLESGKRTAREFYGVDGTVSHLLSDIYGYTQVASSFCGMWQYGGAWLSRHMFEHWLYTGDRDFLENTAYEFIHESAKFLLGMMFEHNGMLLTGPSNSPENRYFTDGPGSPQVKFCLSPTMDVEIIGDVLNLYLQVEEELNKDPELVQRVKAALPKMPPLRVGKHGQLMEWLEDYDEPEICHRHISHLYALFPGWAINEDTPELLEACRVTLQRRLSLGIKPYMCGGTGWSSAWLINLFARLGESEQVYKMLRNQLSRCTKDNMLDDHPPFQIDGNFGTAAGVMEMLLQSHRGRIRVLPALPNALSEGSFTGLKARGGLTVSAEWKDSKVTKLTLQAKNDTAFTLVANGQEMELSMLAGEERQII